MNTDMTTKPQDQRDIEAREALLPCPFCGGTAMAAEVEQIEHCGWVGRIECGDCDAVLSNAYSASSPGRAGNDANDAWNRRVELVRPAPEALEPHRIYQVLDVDACMWEDVTEEQYRERLPSNRRVLFSRPPASLFVSAAPEALGAAKGVELSPSEIHAIANDVRRDLNRTEPDFTVAFARAILAKAKGEQA